MQTQTLTGHENLTFEHHEDGIVIRQGDHPLDESAVFLPYDRVGQLIEMLKRPATRDA